MDDNEKAALLAEMVTLLDDTREIDQLERAEMLLKLVSAAAPEPVKTRMSFEQWLASTADHGDYGDPISRMHASWNAALANAPTGDSTSLTREKFLELLVNCTVADYDSFESVWQTVRTSAVATGKRFEVGDVVRSRGSSEGKWMESVITAVPKSTGPETTNPANVEPLPQTVDLTDDEKVDAIFASRVQRMPESIPNTWKAIAHELATGKTLNELCATYGVETTRRM